ncbi:MAG: hypothetical protein ACLPSW_19660 [Roseiarcus sp.]
MQASSTFDRAIAIVYCLSQLIPTQRLALSPFVFAASVIGWALALMPAILGFRLACLILTCAARFASSYAKETMRLFAMDRTASK